MSLTAHQWNDLTAYARAKLIASFDATHVLASDAPVAQISHKGLYLGVVDVTDNHLARAGFLQDGQDNVQISIDTAIKGLSSDLRAGGIQLEKIHTSTLYLVVVTDVIYIADPLAWDENKDGVYFQWGQDYRGLYLPYEIKAMNVPKIEIMDRLCSHGCGLISNLWRLPCGLCFRLTCQQFTC